MRTTRVWLVVTTTLVVSAAAARAQAPRRTQPAERFEVASIKAVRPTLVDTANALRKGDVKAAKAAFESFDSGWNGIEVYINTRSMEMYNTLERVMQSKLTESLNTPDSNPQNMLAQAEAMLAKYDEAIELVSKAEPLNPRYDDVARLRIVRAHLREVNPAVKAGDWAKARKSLATFTEQWDSIEDLVKERSQQAYDTIEEGQEKGRLALQPATPNADQVTRIVSTVMDEYNKIVAEVTKEARGQ
jgi:hypothetical protein